MWTTKNLVVGQEVFIFDLYQNRDIGTVTEITPSGSVTLRVRGIPFPLTFDINGKGEIGQHPSFIEYGPGPWVYGPWFIDDMPFAERLAHQNEFPWRDIRPLL